MSASHVLTRKPHPRSSGDELEEYRVQGARAVELATEHSSVDPALAIDIGHGKVLVLAGQWLSDPEIYGARDEDRPPGDDGLQYLNGLPPPRTFPSVAFTLTRDPRGDKVLSIQVEGPALALAPPLEVELLPRRPGLADAWLLEGRLEDLPRLLEESPALTAPREPLRLVYAGTRDELRPGDRIRVRRWLRRDQEAVVTYVPGLSPYRRELGLHEWIYEVVGGYRYSAAYAAKQGDELPDRYVLVARGD